MSDTHTIESPLEIKWNYDERRYATNKTSNHDGSYVSLSEAVRMQENLDIMTKGFNACKIAISNAVQQRDELLEAIQTFVDRVDKGEVKSTKTYNQFKELIAKTKTK